MSGSGISSGKSTGMSVVTEKANLVDVLYYVKHLDYVDGNHISLAGCSQGVLFLHLRQQSMSRISKVCFYITLHFVFLMMQDAAI